MRVLKKNGIIIIHDPELSFTFKFTIYLMKHEGYDLTANPYYNFKEYKKTDPWVSNAAFAKLVFSDQKKFEKKFPSLKIMENQIAGYKHCLLLCQCLQPKVVRTLMAESKTRVVNVSSFCHIQTSS